MHSPWFQDRIPVWLFIKKESCSPTSLSALLYSAWSSSRSYSTNSPIFSHSLKICSVVRKNFEWHSGTLPAPLVANHSFTPSLTDADFWLWHVKDLSFKDLLIDHIFSLFQQLQTKFDLPNTHFFRYIHLRNFVKQNAASFPNIPISSLIEPIFLSKPLIKEGTSIIYNDFHV